ncbi:PH domain-containing protein [Staphylococcus kloosii]|uniref:PH domain-containing protein n=1 Tax=Staphylococcus kloosii TaxID=29384 RepID=UPI0028A3397B|nr:PH domain-containing protein [Staphylococcus kloosii]MDT3960094.1 PH domain-containing protein [Staphylococcus kloosii]
MILDNVNPDDLFPTEKKGPTVLGDIEYNVKGEQRLYKGAYIATNERLILNVDMDGQFYYRNIGYNEIKSISLDGQVINLSFEIGDFPIKNIEKGDVETFASFVQQQMN